MTPRRGAMSGFLQPFKTPYQQLDYNKGEPYHPNTLGWIHSADPGVVQANKLLNLGGIGGTMSPQELQRLQAGGYDTSAMTGMSDWARTTNVDPKTGVAHPLTDKSELGFLTNLQNESRYREALGLSQLQGMNAAQGVGAAYGAYGGAMQQLMQGYDQARQEIQGVGQSAVGGLMAREKQQTAESRTGLQSRGLGNTTVLDNARRGIQSQTNTGLADISERIAGLRGGLAERRGSSMFSAGQGLSDLFLKGTDYQNSILSDRQGLIERRLDTYKGNGPQNKTSFFQSPAGTATIAGGAALLAALI